MVTDQVPRAPVEIIEIKVRKNKGHVCLSLSSNSTICFFLKFLFSTPVWLDLIWFNTWTFSSFDKNLAFVGLSGRM
ncbi:hypothetical protein WICPIJ_007888 [Wickerhamomyces pijperi]|uniref:Uncharacterized protein n=1 Tax=Wickerhamomyces pijperi TaxID=599730 RepID=A0A9P8PZ63_WICPI|nr:hypothetical protein WICPIJ_007888 [Wickerhamomyces pijperi]